MNSSLLYIQNSKNGTVQHRIREFGFREHQIRSESSKIVFLY